MWVYAKLFKKKLKSDRNLIDVSTLKSFRFHASGCAFGVHAVKNYFQKGKEIALAPYSSQSQLKFNPIESYGAMPYVLRIQ